MLKWLARWLGVGGPATARGLREQVRDDDPAERRKAADALGGVAEPWACNDLLALLKDTIAEVRDAARAALKRQGAAAVPVLVKAVENGDPRVAVPAAETLGELKHPDAVRPLMLVMKFGSVEIRAAAIRALIRYGSAAVPALQEATQDPDPWTRMRGEEILAEIRAAEAAAPPPAAAEVPPSPAPPAPM
jgi:HEAT repeat protein